MINAQSHALSGAGADLETEMLTEARALRARLRKRLGEAKAREVWRVAGEVKRGRIPGQRRYDLTKLINLFASISSSPEHKDRTRQEIADEIGKFAHETRPRNYGASPQAISKALCRALVERERQDKALMAEVAAWEPSGFAFGIGPSRKGPLGRALADALMARTPNTGE